MNLKQYAFVNEYLSCNDAVIAYRRAYKSESSYKTLESTANRLLKHPEVAEAIERSLTAVRSRVENEIAQRLKIELLSIQEKRVILAQIARGEMYIEQRYKGKDCNVCIQHVKPSFNIMLRAIQEDSRLAGHYADKRTQLKHNKIQQNTSHLEEGKSTVAQQEETPQPSQQEKKHEGDPVLPQQEDLGNEPVTQGPTGVSNPPKTISHAGLRKLLSRKQHSTIIDV